MGILSIFKRKNEEVKKNPLKKLAINKIKSISQKRFSQKSIYDLNIVFKVFIRKRFNISKKNTTNEEIIKASNKLRINKSLKEKINSLAIEFNEIEFKGKTANKETLKMLIIKLKEIINLS